MNKNKILLLAARMERLEFVLFSKGSESYEPLAFQNMDQFRQYFAGVRELLTDMPPKNFDVYGHYLRMMVILKPVIIELAEEDVFQKLKANAVKEEFVEFGLGSLCADGGPMYILKMKKSFVEKHQVMDLMEDIQSTARVGADGIINVNIIEEAEGEGTIATEEHVRKILKERGLL